jgi:UDPglucose 6-dehydrogenase
MLHPDFILIGESDKHAGDLLAGIYRQSVDNQPQVARMSFANAELTKLAVNTFVTTKISYANMLAEICERLEDGNVDAVTTALGLDTRIGAKYLKGSLGYGGPCFPRDNTALLTLAKNLGVVAPIPEATDQINKHQVPRLKHLATSHLPPGGCVGILGLSYKPQTNVIERAQGTELAQALLADGHAVVVHDPWAMDSARPVLSGNIHFAGSVSECARKADVLIVTTPCKEFKVLKAQDLIRPRGRATVIDCWRLFDRAQLTPVCHYVAVGTSDVTAAPEVRELRKAG